MAASAANCGRLLGACRRAALLLTAFAACGCSDEAHIRLFEPRSPPSMDAAADAAREDAAADAAPADASAPSVGPVLRYDFAGSGTLVTDLIGDRDAQLIGGTALDGAGGVELDGRDDYVDLPNGVVSQLQSASFMVWLTWFGGVCWQRVFDFGISDAGEDQMGNAVSALFMTPVACGRQVFMVSAEFSGGAQNSLLGPGPLPQDRAIQVVLTIDAERNAMTMYIDGARIAGGTAAFRLSDIDDRNNWLGRSQWVQDRFMGARYDEFRIYDRALSQGEVTELYERGPNRP